MYLKRLTKEGEKYYINAFTGVTVKIPTVDPLKREPNEMLFRLMNPRSTMKFELQLANLRLSKNAQKSVFIGDFKKLMRTKPEKRDRKEFIKACKRVNLDPYLLFNITYNQYFTKRAEYKSRNKEKIIKKAYLKQSEGWKIVQEIRTNILGITSIILEK